MKRITCFVILGLLLFVGNLLGQEGGSWLILPGAQDKWIITTNEDGFVKKECKICGKTVYDRSYGSSPYLWDIGETITPRGLNIHDSLLVCVIAVRHQLVVCSQCYEKYAEMLEDKIHQRWRYLTDFIILQNYESRERYQALRKQKEKDDLEKAIEQLEEKIKKLKKERKALK